MVKDCSLQEYIEHVIDNYHPETLEELGSGLQANAPYSLHLYSKEELQVLNIPTSRDLIAEDDDNCILAGISATNHVNWTDEDDGVPIAPVAQPLALVSTTPVDLIPNPTSGNVDVAFKILEQGIVTLDIVSLSGAVLRQIETTLAPGEQLLNIDINGLSDGTYMIHGYGAGVDFTVTLVIQNK